MIEQVIPLVDSEAVAGRFLVMGNLATCWCALFCRLLSSASGTDFPLGLNCHKKTYSC